jgi:hypothetical protein
MQVRSWYDFPVMCGRERRQLSGPIRPRDCAYRNARAGLDASRAIAGASATPGRRQANSPTSFMRAVLVGSQQTLVTTPPSGLTKGRLGLADFGMAV